jgi:hypothetical protein
MALSHTQTSQASQVSYFGCFSLLFGARSILCQLFSLRSRFKSLTLFHGFGLFALLSISEDIITALSSNIPSPFLAIFPRILLPLLLVQLYTLWTHTILTYPSTKPLQQRVPPFKATLRVTGPALLVSSAARSLPAFVIESVTRMAGLREREQSHPLLLGVLIFWPCSCRWYCRCRLIWF